MKTALTFLFLLVLSSTTANPAEPALRIAVFGASGDVGKHIVQEALDRGHEVTAVTRKPEKFVSDADELKVVKGDLLDPVSIAEIVVNQDVIVVSVRGVIGDSGEPQSALQFIAAENLVDALSAVGESAPRLIHVGGSGALEVEPGVLFAAKLPTIILPKHLEIEILGQILALEFYGKVDDVRWTYITPPKNFTNGPRTGEFRLGGREALADERGRTRLSRADFAVALIDEAENGRFIKRPFSVAY